jgi:L-ascorbate metabolism protein UlaG (beta-lactamase superfamily)
MKILYWLVGIIIVVVGGLYALNTYMYNEKQGDSGTATQRAVEVTPISHATFVLRWSDTVFYNDPTGGAQAFAEQPPADIVLVSDIHGDHLSTSTLAAVVGPNATLIVPQAVKDLLPAELAARATVLKNGDNFPIREFKITALPMYNLPESSDSRHTKGRGNGYVIGRDDVHVYIAGDTAGIPEMRTLTDIDIAFVPMNLPYTMGIEEAADAVLEFKPKYVYPYHYRGQDGLADINTFKQLVNAGDPNIEVVLANWYPQQ